VDVLPNRHKSGFRLALIRTVRKCGKPVKEFFERLSLEELADGRAGGSGFQGRAVVLLELSVSTHWSAPAKYS
jgi:hypothetical protein